MFAVTEDEPAVATARALIDLYAEISFVQPDAVLLVMSNGKAAAAMRHHAVAIGLQEGQVVFAPPASDAISREQLLRRVEIALFPYVESPDAGSACGLHMKCEGATIPGTCSSEI